MSDLLAALEQIREELVRNRVVAEAQRKLLEELRAQMHDQQRMTRLLLEHNLAAMEDDIAATIGAVQMSMTETLDILHEQRLSMARYGDGELHLMANPGYAQRYQRNSSALRRDLTEAIKPDWIAPGRVLVTLPPPFRGHLYWMGAWVATWSMLKPLINPAHRYGHTLITRPMFFKKEGQAAIEQWRRVWQGRPVLVVTGKGSRFDLVPALFDTATKVDFLYSAPEHAFDDREAILKGVVERADADTLVLLSLGPTATVLAHRIAAAGIQALDVGHLSASYNNVCANGPMPEAMQSDNRG